MNVRRSGVLHHPEQGVLFDFAESARYLGVPKKKFRRMAPRADYVHGGVRHWARRLLGLTPVSEDFDLGNVLEKGKGCGRYVVAATSQEEIRALRHALIGAARGGSIRRH